MDTNLARTKLIESAELLKMLEDFILPAFTEGNKPSVGGFRITLKNIRDNILLCHDIIDEVNRRDVSTGTLQVVQQQKVESEKIGSIEAQIEIDNGFEAPLRMHREEDLTLPELSDETLMENTRYALRRSEFKTAIERIVGKNS